MILDYFCVCLWWIGGVVEVCVVRAYVVDCVADVDCVEIFVELHTEVGCDQGTFFLQIFFLLDLHDLFVCELVKIQIALMNEKRTQIDLMMKMNVQIETRFSRVLLFEGIT
mmetsp:Transcript_9796/g.13204  ORF Transcript_9796/g.13204 Transcript_9796/m.13204 type:complete len:111 (+) Transcript_9796:92-424(+)